MKKGLLTLLVFAVTFALSFGFLADSADAKRGGGFKSNKQSFTQKNDAKKTDNASTTQTNRNNTTPNSAQTTKSGGLFGGNSFLKGLALGGLAGLLFGSMFGNMGAFGEILGLMVNLLLIFGIIMVIRAAWTYVRNSKRPANNGPNYNRYHDYKQHDDENENKR